MSWRTIQIRKLAADNFLSLVFVLVVVGLVGGYLTYQTYADPGTEIERFEDASWESTADYSHQAVVQRDTDVFDRGTVLENQPAYLASVSPVLNGTFQYQYTATDSGELSVATDQTLVLRSVGGEDEQFEYWRQEIDLGTAVASSVAPGDQVTVPFSINVTETQRRVEAIEEQLGGTAGETEILVESNATVSGQRNGVDVDETITNQITIDAQDNVYRVRNTEPVTDSGQQFGQETVTATYGPLRSIAVPVLFVLSLVGVLALAVGRQNGAFELSETEAEWLAYQSAADEFEEWLSAGTIPEEAFSRTTVSVESLEDLVDIAIDSNRRVIRDRGRNRCAVLLEETIYTFEPPETPADSELLPDLTGGGLSEDGVAPSDGAVEDDETADDGTERSDREEHAE